MSAVQHPNAGSFKFIKMVIIWNYQAEGHLKWEATGLFDSAEYIALNSLIFDHVYLPFILLASWGFAH